MSNNKWVSSYQEPSKAVALFRLIVSISLIAAIGALMTRLEVQI